uniref:hypothetical protein n=1 Tax=Veillonella magna TaxID=464322 RepID=UPI00402AD462
GAVPWAAIGGVLGSIGGYMGGEALMENWGTVTDWISSKTKEAGDKAVENYRQSQAELSGITAETTTKEEEMAQLRAQAWSCAWASVKTAWGECQSWFDANVWQPLVSKVEGAKASIISAFNDALEGAKNAWQGITDWFDTNVVSPLKTKFSSLSTMASNFSLPSEIGGSGGSLFSGEYSAFSGKPKGNALGTMYFTGGLTQVNEHGEELINLAGGSRIYPAGQTKRIIQDEVRSWKPRPAEPDTTRTFIEPAIAVAIPQQTESLLSLQIPAEERVTPAIDRSISNPLPAKLPPIQVTPAQPSQSHGRVSVSVSGNTFVVRREDDIDAIVYKLAQFIAEGAGNFGGEVSV